MVLGMVRSRVAAKQYCCTGLSGQPSVALLWPGSRERNCASTACLAHLMARAAPPIAFISEAWFSWRGMDKNPGPIRALLEEGLAHQRAGRLEEALRRYGHVLTADPGN